jgi:hypothetical protein
MTDQGIIYCWGDNTYNQILNEGKKQKIYSFHEPHILATATDEFRKDIFSVCAGNYTTAFLTDCGSEHRNFYLAGGSTIIETIGTSTTIKGEESSHGSASFCKGGSVHCNGIHMIDTLTAHS